MVVGINSDTLVDSASLLQIVAEWLNKHVLIRQKTNNKNEEKVSNQFIVIPEDAG